MIQNSILGFTALVDHVAGDPRSRRSYLQRLHLTTASLYGENMVGEIAYTGGDGEIGGINSVN